MTKQTIRTQEHINTHETEQPNPLDDARETVRALTEEPDFLNGAPANYDMSDSSTDDYLYRISEYTDSFVETRLKDGTLSEEQVAPILLLGATPYAMRQQQLLNSGARLDREYFHHAKDTMAQFNSLVYETMNQNEAVSMHDLATTMSLATTEYTNDRLEDVFKSTSDIARGIRVERTFEHIVEEFGILDIRHATPQEDRKGVDFIVTTPTGNELKIDIKASLDQVAARNNGYDDISAFIKTPDGKFIFYPLISNEMFVDDTCKIKDTPHTQQVKLAIMGQVQLMETKLLQKR